MQYEERCGYCGDIYYIFLTPDDNENYDFYAGTHLCPHTGMCERTAYRVDRVRGSTIRKVVYTEPDYSKITRDTIRDHL
jgi:hypothetical protein